MNKVTTTSTCGRCPATVVREGAHDTPPIGWGPVTIMRRPIGSYLLEDVYCDDLCPGVPGRSAGGVEEMK